ncbi:MAG: Lrp/AsnC family transcriptional regulator, partial [Candidatus Woesearchaeota archaeon]|nr:Lrp/AsnC family transcriptional regulator [Candidatus Woesearchaeota archaeon]
MTKFDHDLIFLASENARAKIRDMSFILKKSPQRLKYSLATIEKEGVIHNEHCIFDYSYFGLILFRVYFKGGYISERDKINIIKKLSANPYIVSMYELSGEFDLVIELGSPNPSRFNKELKKIAELIPTLNNYKILLNLVTHVYSKNYLIKDTSINAPEQDIIIGGDRGVEVFNKNEMKVMKNLLDEPKIRRSKLAKLSDINVKTAVSITKDLRERRIIKGFKYIIDTNKLGINKVRLFIRFHNVSQERENQLMNYMMKTKEVVQVNKTVGDWDMEVDIESFDKIKIRYNIIQIR